MVFPFVCFLIRPVGTFLQHLSLYEGKTAADIWMKHVYFLLEVGVEVSLLCTDIERPTDTSMSHHKLILGKNRKHPLDFLLILIEQVVIEET